MMCQVQIATTPHEWRSADQSNQLRFGALVALRVTPALSRDKGCAPFPAPLSPLVASFLRCASDRFLLTKPNTFPHNRVASVATLRWCSGSSRNAVRLPFGISVQLRRNPHTAGQRTRSPTGIGSTPVRVYVAAHETLFAESVITRSSFSAHCADDCAPLGEIPKMKATLHEFCCSGPAMAQPTVTVRSLVDEEPRLHLFPPASPEFARARGSASSAPVLLRSASGRRVLRRSASRIALGIRARRRPGFL